MDLLERPIVAKEVKNAAFKMISSKPVEMGRFNTSFFKSQCEIVVTQVIEFVQKVFVSGKFPKSINTTLLVLIPKIEHPESFNQFRPISLCNVIFKILTKVLGNCMKLVLLKIIGQGQTSFIPGRDIIENIIVAKEMAHSRRNNSGQKFVAIKIDLQKTYNRLKWEFIEDSLIDVGFPQNIIDITMFWIRFVSILVLWNGSPTETFHPSKGVRQGNPMSPYIFVLCIESLG